MTETINIGFLEHAPAGFHGMVIRNEDDSFTILVDPNDTFEQRMKTIRHELQHILNDDFSETDVQKIEATAHGKKEIRNIQI